MKYFIFVLCLSILVNVEAAPSFYELLGFKSERNNNYQQYQPVRRAYGNGYRRGYGRHIGPSPGGGERYKAICRIHSVDSLAFPGQVGNPICPY